MDRVNIDGLILDSERAVFLKREEILVISDLHIGIEESSLVGIRIHTKDMLDRIEKLDKKYSIKTIILNGDVKHSFGKESAQEWEEVRLFIKRLKEMGKEVIGIKGNHDMYLKNIMREDEVFEYLKVGRFLITHGNKYFEGGEITIIGDEHPSLVLRDELGIKVKIPCFLVYEDLIVMPTFNKLSKGNDILREEFRTPYMKEKERRGEVGEGEVYGINEDEILYFGKLKELAKVID